MVLVDHQPAPMRAFQIHFPHLDARRQLLTHLVLLLLLLVLPERMLAHSRQALAL